MSCTSKDAAAPPNPSHSDALIEIAARVQRLLPDRRDPEKFHMDRAEVVHELRRLARRIGAGR